MFSALPRRVCTWQESPGSFSLRLLQPDLPHGPVGSCIAVAARARASGANGRCRCPGKRKIRYDFARGNHESVQGRRRHSDVCSGSSAGTDASGAAKRALAARRKAASALMAVIISSSAPCGRECGAIPGEQSRTGGPCSARPVQNSASDATAPRMATDSSDGPQPSQNAGPYRPRRP